MIRYLSAEFVLNRMPNGGTAVLIRSVLITTILYFAAIGLKALVEPGTTWQFDLNRAREIVSETIPWYGAIFAAVYLALYSRFASQWSYLASLYNQMMQVAVQYPPNGMTSEDALRLWQAGFIEDAEDLHLASKPMFASVIRSMLNKPKVREYFSAHAPGREQRLARLEERLKIANEAFVKAQGLQVTSQTMPVVDKQGEGSN